MKSLFTKIFLVVAVFSSAFFFFRIRSESSASKTPPSRVLGDVDSKSSDVEANFFNSSAKYNFFPLDPTATSDYVPIKKEDCSDIKIWSGASVSIDVDSGTILHYENGRKKTQIASLTKIMTAVLVMEKVEDLNEPVTIAREALNVPGTVVGCPTMTFCNANKLYVGEKISVHSLLYAMLLDSANDAATALGIHIAGTSEKFVDIMNKKARDLGLKDTHFCTPSGLEIDGHEDECYSSAYDIARIASYSLKYPALWKIMKTEEEKVYSTDGKYMHQLKNTDILLREMPNCIGGKTGFTPLAGKSLLLAATDASKKHRIISVILDDKNRWKDMRDLTDWIFGNYQWR